MGLEKKYKAEQDVLSHSDIQRVDAIFSDALVTTTRNMHAYPKKLLYIKRKRGGLAMPLFSDRAAVGKLQNFLSACDSNNSTSTQRVEL